MEMVLAANKKQHKKLKTPSTIEAFFKKVKTRFSQLSKPLKIYLSVLAIPLILFIIVLIADDISVLKPSELPETIFVILIISIFWYLLALSPIVIWKTGKWLLSIVASKPAKPRSILTAKTMVIEAPIDESEADGPLPVILDKNRHTKRYVIIAIIIACVYLYGPVTDFGVYVIGSQSSSENIKEIANKSGLNYRGKVLFFRSKPELVDADGLNTVCPNKDENTIEYGCYKPAENKMYILRVTDPAYKDIEYSTAAHETLHIAWFKLDLDSANSVTSSLRQFYDNVNIPSAVKLHETMAAYGDDKDVINSELHSFVGSEIASTDIPVSLLTYYGDYFSDRNSSVNSSILFNKKIDQQIASLQLELDALDAQYSTIDAYKGKWLDSFDPIMRRQLYYGDTYNYNINVDKYNKNLANYNSMVDRYNTAKDAYNSRVQSFNLLLKSFYPTKAPINTR